MSSSTRLYDRLGQIPQDPEDPESLGELVVCAFGAFERYYVCWRNKGGEYRQDGHDLQPELKDWLYPTDGSTRDFATLQVVFGRGDEYFASDKNDKMEFKEPEKKAAPSDELEEKPLLRRLRTMPLLRPSSNANTKQTASVVDSAPESSRSINGSQSASRPPSMLFSARSLSNASLTMQPRSRASSTSSRTPSDVSFASEAASRPSSIATTIPSRPPSQAGVKSMEEPAFQEAEIESPVTAPSRPTRRLRPLSLSFNSVSFPRIPEGRQLPSRDPSVTPPLPPQLSPPVTRPTHCTCSYHPEPARKSTYADASVQTSPLPSPPRTALRIDTSASSSWPSYSNASSAEDIQTPPDEYYNGAAIGGNPIMMGGMSSFFSKPGYQLGDSLIGSHYHYSYSQPMFERRDYDYEDEYEYAEVAD